MQKNQKSMSGFVKNMAARIEGEDKEKVTPMAYMGSTMAMHGDDFSTDSEFGQCLVSFGRTHERIARAQETFTAKGTSTWLESTERSLVQMKEYQAGRKKLESRRLAYDTAVTKLEKSKKEDFRLEEEARVQKTKYEESYEDVYRRMQDIQEQEAESIQDLTDFLDAELEYHERCKDLLLQLRQDWPATSAPARPRTVSRSVSSPVYSRGYAAEEAPPLPMERPNIRSNRLVSGSTPQSRAESTERPHIHRATTFEGPRQLRRDQSPMPDNALTRVPTNPQSIREQMYALRPVAGNRGPDSDAGYDSATDPYASSPSRYGENSSPATSIASGMRQVSGRKPPPPPPPSRAKKPPPPPPPMKRGLTSN